ncbi:MAG: LysR family transcriptional regulator [Ensifer adhaerens]
MEHRLLDRTPLEAFRVFDAASRHVNFSRAGRELNITRAAGSRRGKNLELAPPGERLFQRVRAIIPAGTCHR